MSLSAPGNNTSETEVTHISPHGIWLMSCGREMFLAFEHFPWFRDQPVAVIHNVEQPSPGHYYWPDIDVDLSDEIIESPERYPLIAKD